ncbi:hypothetical protein [Moorena sp. SIO4A5]|uniref:hypothetical protein n=1 Tax=Moorena sp. SIO4A5 TaxID=2607838 RepID=UPI0013CCB95C|nr:hypothetical protein [Moorena sp. SIO4A5]NEO18655.1 hypothetical protein [Moorena sp. SIO4A5]
MVSTAHPKINPVESASGVERASCPLWNGHLARCGTGILPVVERASCPLWNGHLASFLPTGLTNLIYGHESDRTFFIK